MKHTSQKLLLGSMVLLRAYAAGQLDGYFRLPRQSKEQLIRRSTVVSVLVPSWLYQHFILPLTSYTSITVVGCRLHNVIRAKEAVDQQEL